MPIEGNAPLAGEALRQYLKRESGNIRGSTALVAGSLATPTESGKAAVRYFGKSLLATAQVAASAMVDIEGTGVLKGLGFTSKQLTDAAAQAVDAQVVEAALTGLAKDAHSATINARAELADMTFKVVQSVRFIVNNPATDPVLRNQVRDAGSALEAQLQGLQTERQSSRETGAEVRGLKDELQAEKKKNKTHETSETVRNAQKDLRLQFMSGEPLRPEDLVMPAEDEKPAEAEAEPKKGRRRAKRT